MSLKTPFTAGVSRLAAVLIRLKLAKLKSTQTAQTSVRLPSWIVLKDIFHSKTEDNRQISICWTALNHCRVITIWCSVWQFWLWTLTTVTLQKLMMKSSKDDEYLWQISRKLNLYYLRNHNKPTNKFTWSWNLLQEIIRALNKQTTFLPNHGHSLCKIPHCGIIIKFSLGELAELQVTLRPNLQKKILTSSCKR